MFGRGIGYNISGPVDGLRALPPPSAAPKRIVECSGWQERLSELDAVTFGASRAQDHRLYINWPDTSVETTSIALTDGGTFLGYGYVDTGARIGPLATHDPADQVGLLRLCGDWLAERDIAEARAWVVSHNAVALGALLPNGWRVNGWTFLLASEPFGAFDRYIPSGGLLL
jgi:hypothetical protein